MSSQTDDTATVRACPFCDNSNIRPRIKTQYNNPATHTPEKRYYCPECETGFDDPEVRGSNAAHNEGGALAVSDDALDAAREALGIEVEDDE